jgi:secreted trypsin-like serine protease
MFVNASVRGVPIVSFVALVLAAIAGLAAVAEAQQCVEPRTRREKVVGGRDAKLANWPSQAVIRLRDPVQRRYEYFCGATLITRDTVLTAAHCVDTVEKMRTDGLHYRRGGKVGPGVVEIVVGTADLLAVPSANVRQIKEIIMHPDYKSAEGGHDIAIIRLVEAIAGQVSRLSLSGKADPGGSWATPVAVAGFGVQQDGGGLRAYRSRTDDDVFAGSEKLLEAIVPYVPRQTCSQIYGNNTIGDGQICAGYEPGQIDSCTGDSGGPLVTFDRNGCAYQIGVVSWGAGCAQAKAYGVYTRISAYAPWLKRLVPGLTEMRDDDVAQTSTDPSPLVDSIYRDLKDLVGAAEGRAKVTIKPSHRVAEGEFASFEISSSVAGKLILIDINAKGEVVQLFPSKFSNQRYIKANDTFVIPDNASYRFKAVAPFGRSRLIVLVAPERLDSDVLITADRQLKKGFEAEAVPLAYFQNLLQQINRTLGGGRGFVAVQTDPLPGWAFATAEYEIAR